MEFGLYELCRSFSDSLEWLSDSLQCLALGKSLLPPLMDWKAFISIVAISPMFSVGVWISVLLGGCPQVLTLPSCLALELSSFHPKQLYLCLMDGSASGQALNF